MVVVCGEEVPGGNTRHGGPVSGRGEGRDRFRRRAARRFLGSGACPDKHGPGVVLFSGEITPPFCGPPPPLLEPHPTPKVDRPKGLGGGARTHDQRGGQSGLTRRCRATTSEEPCWNGELSGGVPLAGGEPSPPTWNSRYLFVSTFLFSFLSMVLSRWGEGRPFGGVGPSPRGDGLCFLTAPHPGGALGAPGDSRRRRQTGGRRRARARYV